MSHRVEKRRRHGEDNPKAKLTAKQVGQIRLSEQGTAILARAFGVHERTIRKIRAYERWNWKLS